MSKISVTILLHGNPPHLKEVVEALHSFDEVLLYDNGASLQSLDVARAFKNVRIVKGSFLGFGPTHNLISNLAKNDWILSIDSDEILSIPLSEEIQKLNLDESSVYSMPRHNEYNGKWIKSCGWYPDRVNRLYNRKKTQFSSALVHEGIEMEGLTLVKLQSPLRHYSYDSISDFLKKMQVYSDLFAKQNVGKKSSSPMKAVLHAIGAFIKSYFVKKGFTDGYEGFLISAYNAHTAFYKYLKLYELSKFKNAIR